MADSTDKTSIDFRPNRPRPIPTPSDTNGTYLLQVVVSGSGASKTKVLSWVDATDFENA